MTVTGARHGSRAGDQRVLVVGGALVAPALAVALARLGRPSVWLDTTTPATSAAADPRPIALANASVQILRGLGLWPPLREAASPIETVHVSQAGHFGKLRLRACDCGVDALGHVVVAGRIASVLADAVSDDPLIEHVTSAQLRLRDDGRGVSVVEATSPARAWSGDLLIVADGRPEPIADLPLTTQQSDYQQVAIAASLNVTRPHAQVAYERFVKGGPLALLPLANGDAGLVWTLPEPRAAALMALDDAEFSARLKYAFGGWLGDISLAGKRAAFPLALKEARVSDPQMPVMLIGNAALQLHPVAGQGFNLALRDVAALVDLLMEPESDPGAPALRGAFQRMRRADRQRVKWGTHLGVRLYSGTSPLSAAIRAPVLGLLSVLPGASRQFARAAMGLTPPQSRLVRGARI
ncbi:MAG: FAD-dependent monooxygenase [Pseudomonadota bacterium]